jgi:molecular chaperone GrpE (heat shock protein)
VDFLEKAAARLKHWLDHNQHHEVDYENFARQLEEANQEASAQCIREMIALTQKSGDCLTKALEALEGSSGGSD